MPIILYPFRDYLSIYPHRNVTPPGGGRPVAVRVDSTTKGPMLYQPQNIANVSLGFNYKGFNAWLSFQYNGLIYTGMNYRGAPRLDSKRLLLQVGSSADAEIRDREGERI